jgi:hypothetical protein
MLDHHDPKTCDRPECEPCLARERQESVIRMEVALLDLEMSAEGAHGAWVDLPVTVDALDVRNVLDLLRG